MRNNRIFFTVPIMPVPWQRMDPGIVKTKSGKIFTKPHKSRKHNVTDAQLIIFLKDHKPEQLITRPIWLGVKVYMLLPASWSKYKKLAALNGDIRPDVKPDLDNFIKKIKDCAKGILWDDDKRVVGYLDGTGKYYSDRPRWEITVEW